MFNHKPKKGIEIFKENEFIAATTTDKSADEVGNFLKNYGTWLSKETLGEYFGELGEDENKLFYINAFAVNKFTSYFFNI